MRILARLGQSPEGVFLVLAVLFGVMFALTLPPLAACDESLHFLRSYHLSEMNLAVERIGPGPEEVGGMLPTSVRMTCPFSARLLPLPVTEKATLGHLRKLLATPLDADTRSWASICHAPAQVTPACYFPQAVGIAAGRVFAPPPVVLIYLGRLASLAFWVACVFCALRLMPGGKWALALLALTPQSLARAASLSYDGPTNASAYLLIALLANFAFDDNCHRITNRALAALFGVTLFQVVTKPVFFVLPMLFLAIPPRKIGSKRRYAGVALGYGLLVMAGTGAALAYSRPFMATFHLPTTTADQIEFMLAHPIRYASAIVFTIVNGLTLDPYLMEGFAGLGTHLIHDTLSSWVLTGYYGVLGLLLVASPDASVRLTCGQRLIVFGVLFAGLGLIATSLYLVATPVGDWFVHIMAGRHLVPLAPLLVVGLWHVSLPRRRMSPRLTAASAATACACFLIAAQALILRTYVPGENLLQYGDMTQWVADGSRPAGWEWETASPAAPNFSARSFQEDGVSGTEQTWIREDGAESIFRQFGIAVRNLTPCSHYRLFVRAENRSDAPVRVSVWELSDSGEVLGRLTPLAAAIAGPSTECRPFSGQFWTGRTGLVRIVASCAGEPGDFPATVVWDSWEIERISCGMPWRRLMLRTGWDPGRWISNIQVCGYSR